ncbi:hypothetical protein PIB30_075100 [Stylosanthes scabra]|uniref:Uncharacterized protein n=1 Tax=Stylosanthes scabra TaxID=79078 RepID=A0ABU6TS29_9FABA|nr:hypothetical protein [Stylosanthes scabra]
MTLTPIIVHHSNRYTVSPSNHHIHNQNHNPSPLCNNISNNNNNEHEAEEEEDDEEEKHDVAVAKVTAAEETVQKPWNLRRRKWTAPAVTGGASRGSGKGMEAVNNEGVKSMRLWGMPAAMVGAGEVQCSLEKRKFWITLSRDEIKEDIFIMTGSFIKEEEKEDEEKAAAAAAAWVTVVVRTNIVSTSSSSTLNSKFLL